MPAQSRRRVKAVSSPTVVPVASAQAERGERRRWPDTYTFVLALVGASIGFKTIWQFPYLATQNGGGAFIAAYILLALVFGAPLLMAQIMLGRRTHASPVKALKDLGENVPGGRHWGVVGVVAVIGGLVVFSYLSVIAGWMIAYVVRTLFGIVSGVTADGIASLFAVFVRDPEKQIFWHTLFIAGVGGIVALGMRDGILATVRWLTPVLYVVLLAIAVYALQVGSFEDAAGYLFAADFTKLSPLAWMTAAAQVFFSLGLGTGVALMYGAHLKADASIPRAALTVVALDALTGIVAAVVVFAVLFGGSIAPASGPALVFQALPLAFDHLPLGRWFGALFFLLLVVIAVLMGIGLLEPVIVWLEERFKFRRRAATVCAATAAWILGVVAMFALNPNIFPFNYAAFSFKFTGFDVFSMQPLVIEKTLGVFDILQTATAEFLLPLSAGATAIFVGWFLPREKARAELNMRSRRLFAVWLWLLRLLVPATMLLLLLTLYRL